MTVTVLFKSGIIIEWLLQPNVALKPCLSCTKTALYKVRSNKIYMRATERWAQIQITNFIKDTHFFMVSFSAAALRASWFLHLVCSGPGLCDEVLLQMERKIGPPVKMERSEERPGHHQANAILLLSRLLPLTLRSLSNFLGLKIIPILCL